MAEDEEGLYTEDDPNVFTDEYNASEDALTQANRGVIMQNSLLRVSDISVLHASGNDGVEESSRAEIAAEKDWQVDLINLVHNYPCIWNTTARSFKETPKKTEAWRRISVKLNIEGKHGWL